MIKSVHFSLIVLLQPNSARFQPDHVYWDSKIFSLPYSKWTWKTVEKLKKIVASAWVWTHIILGKQKVDEISPKTLPLSYRSILQIMTYRLKFEYFYIAFYSYNYKKVKMKQKCWFLEKSSLNWVLFDAYQLYTVHRPLRSCQKLVRIKIDLNLRFEWCEYL